MVGIARWDVKSRGPPPPVSNGAKARLGRAAARLVAANFSSGALDFLAAERHAIAHGRARIKSSADWWCSYAVSQHNGG